MYLVKISVETYRRSPMTEQKRIPAWPAAAYDPFRVFSHWVRGSLLRTEYLKHLVQRRNKAYRRSVLVLAYNNLPYRYICLTSKALKMT